MFYPVDFVKASLKAGWAIIRPSLGETELLAEPQQASEIVPIRSLGSNQGKRIAAHLLSLTAGDRYLRFGYAVQDEHIQSYVDGLDFERDEVFGIFDRKLALLAVAHLAYGQESNGEASAEFGVSVSERARGRGYGKRLFDRAAMHAVNQGVHMMYIQALSENAAMLNIARAAGARVKREGAESEAYLQLPQATLGSRLAEAVEQQIADADYRFKRQAKQFHSLLTGLQEVRSGVSEAQKRHPH